MKKIILGLSIIGVLGACNDESKTTSEAVVLNNGLDSFSYYIGLTIGKDLRNTGITDLNIAYVKQGMHDVFEDDSMGEDPQVIQYYVNNYFEKIEQEKNDKERKELENWIKENRDFNEVVAANEGYFYRVITEGEGEQPGIRDIVTVHYKGSLLDGKIFDSSVGGEPITMPLNRFIRGWAFGVMNMKKGAKYELYIPSFLAYGSSTGPTGSLPPNSPLVFEVELLDIEKADQQ